MIEGNAPRWASESLAVIDRRVDQLNRYPAGEFGGLRCGETPTLMRISQADGQTIRVGYRQRSLAIHSPGIGGLIAKDIDLIEREYGIDQGSTQDNLAGVVLAVAMQKKRAGNPFNAAGVQGTQLKFLRKLAVIYPHAGDGLDRYGQPIGVESHEILRTPVRRDTGDSADAHVLDEADAGTAAFEGVGRLEIGINVPGAGGARRAENRQSSRCVLKSAALRTAELLVVDGKRHGGIFTGSPPPLGAKRNIAVRPIHVFAVEQIGAVALALRRGVRGEIGVQRRRYGTGHIEIALDGLIIPIPEACFAVEVRLRVFGDDLH